MSNTRFPFSVSDIGVLEGLMVDKDAVRPVSDTVVFNQYLELKD
jgi:hypothetical protein